MTPAEILKAAKAKIADPANWCQGSRAKDSAGRFVAEIDDSACQWCAIGALLSVSHGSGLRQYTDARIILDRAAEKESGYTWSAAGVNDMLGHKRTMSMFDKAIELAEASA